MKVVLLGLTSDDVGTSVREMQVTFGDALQAALVDVPISAAIETIFITPVVTRPGIGPFPDRLSYLRAEPAANVSINIPYAQWANGARADHVNLIATAITDAVGRIKASLLDARAKTAIVECVEKTRRRLLE